MTDESVCPFCGEPVTRERYLGRHQQFCCKYRCGTEGPDINGEYDTGRICDMHTYQRLLKERDDEIELLKAERDEAVALLTANGIHHK